MPEEQKVPEELAQDVALKNKIRAAREKFISGAKIAVNSAPEDANVRIVLRYLAALSGFQANPVAVKADGDVAVNATIYNGGRESVYHDMRKMMSAETRNLVERSEE